MAYTGPKKLYKCRRCGKYNIPYPYPIVTLCNDCWKNEVKIQQLREKKDD
jgi:hypothetical protein